MNFIFLFFFLGLLRGILFSFLFNLFYLFLIFFLFLLLLNFCLLILVLQFLPPDFLCFTSLFAGWKGNITKDLIIILEDISDNLTIGNVIVIFFDPEGPHKFDLAQLIISLLFLHLPICLLEMGKPVSYFLSLDSSTENVDASGSENFEPDSRVVLTIHLSQQL